MKNLSRRDDEFSVQITSPDDAMLFVRIEKPTAASRQLVCSDLIFAAGHEATASAALTSAFAAVGGLRSGTRVKFKDIAPGNPVDTQIVTQKHDQVRAVMEQAIANTQLSIANCYLEPSGDRFDTIVEF